MPVSMNVRIGRLLSVEMLRDGGSLAAIWVSEGVRYSLVLPIRFDNSGSERIGYDRAVLVNKLLRYEAPMDWRAAAQIVSALEPRGLDPLGQKWLSAMREVIQSKGDLPSCVASHLGPKRPMTPSSGRP